MPPPSRYLGKAIRRGEIAKQRAPSGRGGVQTADIVHSARSATEVNGLPPPHWVHVQHLQLTQQYTYVQQEPMYRNNLRL